VNEEALVHWGPLRHKQTSLININISVYIMDRYWVLKENMTNKLMIFKERPGGKYLVLQEQMMATGELKLIKK